VLGINPFLGLGRQFLPIPVRFMGRSITSVNLTYLSTHVLSRDAGHRLQELKKIW